MTALLLAVILAQQQYPPEGQPIQPSIPVLWMTLPAPVEPDLPADSTQPMRVLMVVSPLVTTSQATANARCASWIASGNTVLANDPAMPGRLQLAGCRIATHYTDKGTLSADLAWVQSDPTVAKWRNDTFADQVTFDSTHGDSCGYGYQCAAQTGAAWAFTAVNDGCAVGNFSFIHEFGHNACAAHDPPNQTPTFSYGSGFCDSAHSRRDPMTYPQPCGGSRVPYFGNPTISPFGYPFGIAATADNARVWREQWAKIAGFRPAPPITTHRPSTVTSLQVLQ